MLRSGPHAPNQPTPSPLQHRDQIVEASRAVVAIALFQLCVPCIKYDQHLHGRLHDRLATGPQQMLLARQSICIVTACNHKKAIASSDLLCGQLANPDCELVVYPAESTLGAIAKSAERRHSKAPGIPGTRSFFGDWSLDTCSWTNGV